MSHGRRLADRDGACTDTVALVERRRALEAELDDVRRQESERRLRALKVIEEVAVVTPCRESWRRMVSDPRDSRIRHCLRCRKDVHDLSAFDAVEVESLLQRDSDLCGRLRRRLDGTIVTADCPPPPDQLDCARSIIVRVCLLLLASIGVLYLWAAGRTTMGMLKEPARHLEPSSPSTAETGPDPG